jgi:predicted nucleotidyltransferase
MPNTHHDIPEFIRAIADRIAREYQPEKIILFGSYAWGEPGPDSDVDLFIVKETVERARDRRVRVKELLWDKGSRVPIDVIVITPTELNQRLSIRDRFCELIVRNGEALYAA